MKTDEEITMKNNVSGQEFVVILDHLAGANRPEVAAVGGMSVGSLSEAQVADLRAAGKLRSLGVHPSWEEAQRAAEQDTYVARRWPLRDEAERLIREWDCGYKAVPAHAAQPGDSPLGEFSSQETARLAAVSLARRQLTAMTTDQAVDIMRYLSVGHRMAPRGLVEVLAAVLAARPCKVPGRGGGLTYLDRWTIEIGERNFFLEEHYNPKTGTCCSKVRQEALDAQSRQ